MIGWMVALGGCGIVELWVQSAPVDTGLELAARCEEGVLAYCTCRIESRVTPCSDDQIDESIERCLADPAFREDVDCFASKVDQGSINCIETSECTQLTSLVEATP